MKHFDPQLELSDIPVESLVPAPLRSAPDAATYMSRLPEFDSDMGARLKVCLSSSHSCVRNGSGKGWPRNKQWLRQITIQVTDVVFKMFCNNDAVAAGGGGGWGGAALRGRGGRQGARVHSF